MKKATILILTLFSLHIGYGQHVLPTPGQMQKLSSSFRIGKELSFYSEDKEWKSAQYLKEKLAGYVRVTTSANPGSAIVLAKEKNNPELGNEGYRLVVEKNGIKISANSDAGLFYGIQSLLQLLPEEVQSGKPFKLNGYRIAGIDITDKPKYGWRSFMLDSGRQYQSPAFIKRYLDLMAMLKMNVFHWHLTEGMGWRIEIKKFPRLTEIGSNLADGKQQQGFYTQEQIRDIVGYAAKLNITVVPEIDLPGHSEAALTAYPEYTCFNEKPETVMSFSPVLFCAGKEKTYTFLQQILDEVCELFPSEYIHLGGDEAPKQNWDKCPDCQKKIADEHLANTHTLQLYFSARLANYMKGKGKKVIFWGDVVYQDDYKLPDNVVIHWWNWRANKDLALKNAIKNGYPVICNTNYYTYLNFPVIPWSKYNIERTFDMRMAYEQNPSHIKNPNALVMGMGCAIWTDWYVLENMIDQRVFPRIYVLAEQMWNNNPLKPFDQFYDEVKSKYPLLKMLGIDYGPALKNEVPGNYRWD